MPDLPYQNEPQVEQALAERANAETYGQKTLVAAADKVLAGFGITSKAQRDAAAKHRRAAAETSEEEEPEKSAPAGRSSTKKSKADES